MQPTTSPTVPTTTPSVQPTLQPALQKMAPAPLDSEALRLVSGGQNPNGSW